MTSRVFGLLAVVLLVVVACSGDGAHRSPRPPRSRRRHPTQRPRHRAVAERLPASLTVFAAASLKGALDKAKAAYEAANPGTTVNVSTDSSSALETKIEQGAPADVFLSADTKNPQNLVDKGLRRGRPSSSQATSSRSSCPRRTPAASHPRRTSPRPASRSSPPATTCRSPSTPASSSRTWPRSRATRRTSRPSTRPTSSRRRTTSRPSSPRSSSARAMPGSST